MRPPTLTPGILRDVDVRPATAHSLLERADELRRIRRVLDGEGGVVVIAAPAGLGKTKVLEAAIADARAEGIQTLIARSSELERDFAFGVVRQLLEAAVLDAGEQRAELLSGAARQAAAVLDLDPDAALDRDVHATLHGLYWLLVNLAAGEPLLVAVDDLQWADEPSLRWLAYVARRLERVPITLLATVRTGEHGRAAELPAGASELTAAAIDELVGHVRTLRVEPAPLSVNAVAEVLERSLGEHPTRPSPRRAGRRRAATPSSSPSSWPSSPPRMSRRSPGTRVSWPTSCPSASATRSAAISPASAPTPARSPRRWPCSATAATRR